MKTSWPIDFIFTYTSHYVRVVEQLFWVYLYESLVTWTFRSKVMKKFLRFATISNVFIYRLCSSLEMIENVKSANAGESVLGITHKITRNVSSFHSSNNVVISTSLFCSISANVIKGVNKQEARTLESGAGNTEKVKTHRQECRKDLHIKASRASLAARGDGGLRQLRLRVSANYTR